MFTCYRLLLKGLLKANRVLDIQDEQRRAGRHQLSGWGPPPEWRAAQTCADAFCLLSLAATLAAGRQKLPRPLARTEGAPLEHRAAHQSHLRAPPPVSRRAESHRGVGSVSFELGV